MKEIKIIENEKEKKYQISNWKYTKLMRKLIWWTITRQVPFPKRYKK